MNISPEDFPSNSIVKTEPAKKEGRVVKGVVRQRKAPFLDRIFGGETAKSIGEYIIWDVLIPAAKSTFSDIVSNTIEMALYGETGAKRSNRLRRDRDRTIVSYNSMYNKRSSGRSSERSREPRRVQNRHRFDGVVIESRVDAEEVLSTLIDFIEQYEMATVADFYDACGLSSEYTDRRFGWEDLHNASVHPVRGGYIIDLPKPHPID